MSSFRIYSKDNIISTIKGMLAKDCLYHCFLLTGEKGVGKKVGAMIIASMILCEHPESPCLGGEIDNAPLCRHCKRIVAGSHPDMITPERGGKTMAYPRPELLRICADAYVMPNDCQRKIYFFPEADSILRENQGIMLKTIEEPPDHCYIIFTASSKEAFLKTITSRMITIGVASPSKDEARGELLEMGYSEDEVNEATSRFHGNIGMCLEYLKSDELKENVRAAINFIQGIISANEYEMIKALSPAGDNRKRLRDIILITLDIIRDGLAIRTGSNSISGCDKELAVSLANTFSYQKFTYVYDCCYDVLKYINANANTQGAVCRLASEVVFQ